MAYFKRNPKTTSLLDFVMLTMLGIKLKEIPQVKIVNYLVGI